MHCGLGPVVVVWRGPGQTFGMSVMGHTLCGGDGNGGVGIGGKVPRGTLSQRSIMQKTTEWAMAEYNVTGRPLYGVLWCQSIKFVNSALFAANLGAW